MEKTERKPDESMKSDAGYSNDPIMANYPDYGFSGAMTKPYEVDELKEMIGKTIVSG